MRNISLLLLLFLVGLTNAETLPDRQKNRVDFCLDLGLLTPHGYGANVAVSLDFKSLNGYRPFAAFGFNVITGLTYSTGIEYHINPRFKLGLLFSVAGGEELGQHHMYWDEASEAVLPANRSKILLFNSYFDLIKSRYLDLLLGAALGIANVNTLRETSDRGLRLFATPAFSAGIRY